MEGNFLRIRNDFCESVSLRVSEESPPPASREPRGVPTGVPCGVPRGVPECGSRTTSLLSDSQRSGPTAEIEWN